MSAPDELGLPVHWKPALPPPRQALPGLRVLLEPFHAATHRDALHSSLHADGDPRLWEYLPYGPFDERAWSAWFSESEASDDPLFFAIVERASGVPLGQASYLRVEPGQGVIEIGHIALGPALQRTPAATEAMFLLARHAFDDLGYRRLEWKCNALNARSRRAAERLGFTFEGVFRQHMMIKGRNRDTAWYSVIDREWPRVRAAFEQWLAPDNFDEAGRQRRSLGEVRASIPEPGRGAPAANVGGSDDSRDERRSKLESRADH
jgi:RimJ/RimL family protein N-acetyltransferase